MGPSTPRSLPSNGTDGAPIIAAKSVDEVKDIRDKALALEKYAQQARNIDAEKRAASIRIRAEMKGAQLYRESEKAKRGPDKKASKPQRSQRSTSDSNKPPPKTLKEVGISKTQSANWQQLADNPKAVEAPRTRCELCGAAGDRGRARDHHQRIGRAGEHRVAGKPDGYTPGGRIARPARSDQPGYLASLAGRRRRP